MAFNISFNKEKLLIYHSLTQGKGKELAVRTTKAKVFASKGSPATASKTNDSICCVLVGLPDSKRLRARKLAWLLGWCNRVAMNVGILHEY